MDAQNGIPAVVKGLCNYQNKIEGVESRVLSLYAKVDNTVTPNFDYLGDHSFCGYVKDYMPDIVIFHDFYYLKYATMALTLKRLRIPFVLEPHGAFGKKALKKSRLKKFVANHTIFSILIKGSAGFILTNEGELKDVAYKKEKKFVIPNGVDRNAIDELDYKNFDPSHLPVFYFLGRYDRIHKGLDYLFDALDIIERNKKIITVKLYGVGSEEELAYVHDRIKDYKIIKVEEKGTIFGQEKVDALRNNNILLLTSRYEGSPMTILDALCYGNPCLLTPGTNVADEISNNGLGWKTNLDANAIAECILRAQEEYRKDYEGYYNRCKQYMIDNSLWDNIALKSISIYKLFLK